MSGKQADKNNPPRLPEGVTVRERSVTDYERDPKNLNRPSKRGRKLLADSYSKVGPARSWVVTEDDVLIAGNQSQGAALDAGITKVIEIEAPPDTQIVVKLPRIKSGDDMAAIAGALDNRARDLSEYDASMVAAERTLLEAADIFRPDEIDALIADQAAADAVADALSAFDEVESDDGPARGLTNERGQTVKLVLNLPDVALVERAIKHAAADLGTTNRAEAVAFIFERYLESDE